MKETLLEAKKLKIVPENFKSATVFEIEDINGDKIKINLPEADKKELEDYKKGAPIEAFGLAKRGLIYFETKISDKSNNNLLIEMPEEIKEIQRRKYSRVEFDGKLTVAGYESAAVKTCDISAGGLKFISDKSFMVGEKYDIRLELVNNLVVDCTIQPIRVEETDEQDSTLKFSISAKYQKIRSIDRIALMQFSLRRISESENKL